MRNLLLLLCCSALISACSVLPWNAASKDENSNSLSNISTIRVKALQDAAMTYGARAGLAVRARQINQAIVAETAFLDRIFSFRSLLLPHNVLPPVLLEARHSLHLSASDTIRLSDRTYQILAPERFVSSPPTWQHYLWMDYAMPDIPHVSVLPRTQEERALWDQAIEKGWHNGIEQASQIFLSNLALLKRDFIGIATFRILLAKKMITPPSVAKAHLGVTGDDHELRINDQVLRITAKARLQRDTKEWRSALYKTTFPH